MDGIDLTFETILGCLHHLFLFPSEDLVLLLSQLVLFFSHEI